MRTIKRTSREKGVILQEVVILLESKYRSAIYWGICADGMNKKEVFKEYFKC